jgi:RNA polymerase sigma-70 factor (ECF subfamily)
MSDSPDAEKDLNSPSTYVDFGALLGQYLPKIQGFLLRETRDYDSSLDLSQEVSLRAWRGFAKFRGGCSIGTWLRKITINVVHTWRASAW